MSGDSEILEVLVGPQMHRSPVKYPTIRPGQWTRIT